MTNLNYLEVSKIFSSAFMDSMANKDIVQIDKTINLVRQNIDNPTNKQVKTIINDLYKKLANNYRNEHYYKNNLYTKIVSANHKFNECLTLTELSVGNSKLDLAVFNGTSTAYEIKSEIDSPKRLIQQLNDYVKAFEYVYLVSYWGFYQKIKKDIPKNIGVLLLDNDNFHEERKPKSNLKKLEYQYIFNILRLSEFKNIVEQKFKYIPDVPNTLIYKECFKLFEKIDLKELHKLFLNEIRKRELPKHQQNLINKLPNSIKVSTISKRYTEIQCSNLIEALNNYLY